MNDLTPMVTIEEHTIAIRDLCTRTVENVVQIGEHLIAVKAQLPHGQFLDWLNREFTWSDRTAEHLIRVSEMVNSKTFSNLLQFDISALYVMARDTLPEPVREAAIQQAANGERVTARGLKKAIAAERAKTGTKPARTKGKRTPVVKIDVPYRKIIWPTAEEIGAPPADAPRAEQMAHMAKYGRVQLHPKTVKDMLDCQAETNALVMSIVNLANPNRPDADRFFDSIDQLMAWTPKRDKTNGEQTDFARKARETMRLLKQYLPVVLPLLQALDARLNGSAQRKSANGECNDTVTTTS